MSDRGANCLDVTFDEGHPVFTFACDCGQITDVRVDGLTETSIEAEFAFTCNMCTTVHWVTIVRNEDVDQS